MFLKMIWIFFTVAFDRQKCLNKFIYFTELSIARKYTLILGS